jgi:hypothetical protein
MAVLDTYLEVSRGYAYEVDDRGPGILDSSATPLPNAYPPQRWLLFGMSSEDKSSSLRCVANHLFCRALQSGLILQVDET